MKRLILILLFSIVVGITISLYLKTPPSSSTPSSSPSSSTPSSSPSSSTPLSTIMRAPSEKRNIIMVITGNVQSIVERYQSQNSSKIRELKNFVTLAKNILGPNDITPLCYNVDNITDNDVEIKGTKIINNLLFNALRKAIDNNNYLDIAALIICLYRYDGQFDWLGRITENDNDGNPSKIGIEAFVSGQSGVFSSPAGFINFTERTGGKTILSEFEIGTPDYIRIRSLYDDTVSNTSQEPMSIENFGKLYALLGLYLLKLKDKNRNIGFKQMQFQFLNPRYTIYPPCDI